MKQGRTCSSESSNDEIATGKKYDIILACRRRKAMLQLSIQLLRVTADTRLTMEAETRSANHCIGKRMPPRPRKLANGYRLALDRE